jgi:hypothetical protein
MRRTRSTAQGSLRPTAPVRGKGANRIHSSGSMSVHIRGPASGRGARSPTPPPWIMTECSPANAAYAKSAASRHVRGFASTTITRTAGRALSFAISATSGSECTTTISVAFCERPRISSFAVPCPRWRARLPRRLLNFWSPRVRSAVGWVEPSGRLRPSSRAMRDPTTRAAASGCWVSRKSARPNLQADRQAGRAGLTGNPERPISYPFGF